MKYLNFSVIIEEDKQGFFASCPELQGCYTQGKSYEETMENIRDAIKLHVKDRLADKSERFERIKSITLSTVEVAV